jgi:hypothetical protein
LIIEGWLGGGWQQLGISNMLSMMIDSDFPALPSDVEMILTHAVGKLLIDRYSSHFGEEEAARIAVAILNLAFVMETDDESALRFARENQVFIEQQAQAVHLDPKISDAFSLLYSFMLVRLGPTNPERSRALSERATDLFIVLRTTEEIYPTNDAFEFLSFVRRYALELISGGRTLGPN